VSFVVRIKALKPDFNEHGLRWVSELIWVQGRHELVPGCSEQPIEQSKHCRLARRIGTDENGVVAHIDVEVGNPLVVGDDDR